MPQPAGRQLKIYSRLAQAAMQEGLVLPLRLWHACRALDPQGSGWLTVSELCRAWPQTGRTIRTVLKRGEGTFWTVKQGVISLVSLKRVCEKLGTLPGDAVLADFERCAKSLAYFKACCYGAFFAGENGRTIGRSTLSEMYGGVTRQTMRNWERETGIQRQQNVAELARFETREGALTYFVEHTGMGSDVFVWQNAVYWVRPNTYFCPLETAAPPVWTARRLRRACTTVRQVSSEEMLRLYYTDELAAMKAANKNKIRTGHDCVYGLTNGWLGVPGRGARVWRAYFGH